MTVRRLKQIGPYNNSLKLNFLNSWLGLLFVTDIIFNYQVSTEYLFFFRSVFHLTKLAIPHLIETKGEILYLIFE